MGRGGALFAVLCVAGELWNISMRGWFISRFACSRLPTLPTRPDRKCDYRRWDFVSPSARVVVGWLICGVDELCDGSYGRDLWFLMVLAVVEELLGVSGCCGRVADEAGFACVQVWSFLFWLPRKRPPSWERSLVLIWGRRIRVSEFTRMVMWKLLPMTKGTVSRHRGWRSRIRSD